MMRKNEKIKIVSLLALCITCAASGALALNSYTAKAETEDIFHELGASVRVSEDKGIRFAFGLPESLTGDDYEIGTLIIPKVVLGSAVLNHNDDPVDEVDVAYEPIACSKNWVPNEKLEGSKDGYKYYNAALTEIPQLNYDTILVARSYYVKDGVYTYSDPVERSIGYVASAALNDGYVDTNNILTDIVTTAYGETELNVTADEDILGKGETTTLSATNEKNYLPVWSSSNEAIATVDKTGKVVAVAGGEATITAKMGNKTSSKTVYIASADLKTTDFNRMNWSWNESNVAVAEVDNGFELTAKFGTGAAATGYWVKLAQSKAYYEKLASEGYVLSFDLTVGGEEAWNWKIVKVFGKTLGEYGFTSASGKIIVSMDALVAAYDIQKDLASKEMASVAQSNYWFTIDRVNDYARSYTFTITNYEYKPAPMLEADFDGTEAILSKNEIDTLEATSNWDVSWTTSDASVVTVKDGVVTAVGGGVATVTATVADKSVSKTYYVASADFTAETFDRVSWGWDDSLTVEAVENGYKLTNTFGTGPNEQGIYLHLPYSRTYYEKLAAEGYSFIFDLTVGGEEAWNWSFVQLFGSTLNNYMNGKTGRVTVSMDKLLTAYDFMATVAAGEVKSAAKANYLFSTVQINDYKRAYEFTLTNMEFTIAPTLEADFDGTESILAKDATETLVATSNKDVVWSTSDANVVTVENGVVTAVGAGQATVTATAGTLTASKTYYVASADLKAADFNRMNWSWNEAVAATTVENGYTFNAKFGTGAAGVGYWIKLSQPKSYYEKLAAEGYLLSFDLTVSGEEAWNWKIVKVFGKTLGEYGFTSASGKIIVSMDALVAAYDIQKDLASKEMASVAQSNYWFTIDRVNDYARSYTFTVTNYEYIAKPETAELSFVDASDAVINKSGARLPIVTNLPYSDIAWTSSDNTIATVANGVITGLKAGNVTITATADGITASKTVYVASADLKASDFNRMSWNWNQTNPSVTEVENGYTINATFGTGAAGVGYWVKLAQEKVYYEKLAAAGYSLTFDLTVGGDEAWNWKIVKVFGKTLEELGFTGKTGKVTISMAALVAAYDIQADLASKEMANVAQSNYWFTIDRVNDYARAYTFTITNYEYVKV